MYTDSTSGEVAAAYLRAIRESDVVSELAHLVLPVLILHNRDDPGIAFEWARLMARATPSATLIALPGKYHSAYGTAADAARVVAAVREFLGAPLEGTKGTHTAPEPGRALTPRELEVLRLIVSGRSTREISEHLVLSERTVARHIANIYTKIGAHGRAEATAYAFRIGIA